MCHPIKKKEKNLQVLEANSWRTITQALNKVWVNIVDLIDCRRNGSPVLRHKSQNALRTYSKGNDKIYNLKLAKQNGFLTALLIHM